LVFFCRVSNVTVVVSFAVFTVLESLLVVVVTVPLLQAAKADKNKRDRYFFKHIIAKIKMIMRVRA
jgi:hypothetical protein